LRWQGAGERRSVAYQSEGFTVNHTTGRDFGALRLSEIGEIPIRARRDLPDAEDVRRAMLRKEATGDRFARLVIEADEPEKPAPADLTPEDRIGVDLGIGSFIHTSDDLSVGCLDLSDEYDRYAREQRSLARKDAGRTAGNSSDRPSPAPSTGSSERCWTLSTSSRTGWSASTTWWRSRIRM